MKYLTLLLPFLYFVYSQKTNILKDLFKLGIFKFLKVIHKPLVNIASFSIILIAFLLAISIWIIKFNGSLTGFYYALMVFSFLTIYAMYFRDSTIDL